MFYCFPPATVFPLVLVGGVAEAVVLFCVGEAFRLYFLCLALGQGVRSYGRNHI